MTNHNIEVRLDLIIERLERLCGLLETPVSIIPNDPKDAIVADQLTRVYNFMKKGE